MRAPFFCVVEGMRGPKRQHPSLQAALKEARRLQARRPDEPRRIFVLGTVATVEVPPQISAA
jgi:hypothetical protein